MLGIAGDLEKEKQKSGDDEKNEPDGNAGEFGGDGEPHRLMLLHHRIIPFAQQLRRLRLPPPHDPQQAQQLKELRNAR